MELTDYKDKFWYAERYFNALRLENYFIHEEEYHEFKCFLNARLFVYPIPFMTFHNLFMMHFVFNEHKIAINYHLKKLLPPFQYEPTEMQKLGGKIMKLQGWEVLDLS